MKDIGEKTRIIQTWEASSFFLKMVSSAFGKPARNTVFLSKHWQNKNGQYKNFYMGSSQGTAAGEAIVHTGGPWVPS